ncbi:MAG TPA: hypothetical protein VHO43_08145 [Ignavibacteriales bacterium]|nr:hypothetical protein [Ignavibacteriales bacterium]
MRQCCRIFILITIFCYLNIYPQESSYSGLNPGGSYSGTADQKGVSSGEINPKEIYPPNSREVIPALNFKDTDLRDILRSIAFEYHTNIVVDNSINGRASAALFNVSVLNAIEMIARDNGYDFSYDSLRFYVKPMKVKLPPPVPEAEPEVQFNKGKLSLKLMNADINKLVEKLRSATGKNFLLNQGTSGRLSGELKNVELETGLKNILQNNGFFLTASDSIFYIARSGYFSSLEGSNAPSKSAGYWVNACGSVSLILSALRYLSLRSFVLSRFFEVFGPIIKAPFSSRNENSVPLKRYPIAIDRGTSVHLTVTLAVGIASFTT